MKRPDDRDRLLSTSEIRALLRDGDPCRDGQDPPADEVARLRRTILAESRTYDPPRRRLVPAALAAALLAGVFAGSVLLIGPADEPHTPEPGSPVSETAGPPASEPDRPRQQQVQFVTANGTRVIWVLRSDLKL